MIAQTQQAILSGLKAMGGIVASLGSITAAFSTMQGVNPEIGLYIAAAGIVIHGLSTAINELVSIFQTVPMSTPIAAVPAPVEAPKI